MSDVTYVVRTKYETDTSQAAAGIDKLSRKASGLGGALEAAKGMIDGLAAKAAALGTALAGAGAIGAALAIKTGLVDVNAQIEDAQIGFATMFRMLGATDSFDQGLGIAKGLLADIRKDAQDLPGEFQDFVGMAQTLTAPLLNAGKGLKEIRDLTRQTAVAGAAMQIPFDQAAREMAELIEGRAGTHNKLGMRMGITAHTTVAGGAEFNQASTEQRLALLGKLLSKNDEALIAYQKSWKGLTSTAVDSLKQLLGRATSPLFERVKQELVKLNSALGSTKLEALADRVGVLLVKGFDFAMRGVDWIERHWPAIVESAKDFGARLYEAFEKIRPIVEKIASVIAEHPGGVVQGLMGARIGLGVATSGVGDALAGVGAAGGAALAVAAVGAVGALDLITAKAGELPPALDAMSQKSQEYWEDVKSNWKGVWEDIKGIGKDLLDVFRPLADVIGFDLLVVLRGLGSAVKVLSGVLKKFTGWIRDQLAKVGLAAGDEDTEGDENMNMPPDREAFLMKQRMAKINAAKPQFGPPGPPPGYQKDIADALVKAATKLPGMGKTNVTVNAPLTVLSDADPERLAKKVATHISDELRNAKTSHSLAAFRHV